MSDETQKVAAPVAEPVTESAVEPNAAEEPAEEPAEQSAIAAEPVTMVDEPPVATPSEISDQVPLITPEGTMERVKVWLAEARYFISTLEHEVSGDAGEVIAWLKARL